MTATEELRRMLDERGVEWSKPKSATEFMQTTFLRNGWGIEVLERNVGLCVTATNIFDTPEQVIAATLGSGKLTAEQVREAIERNFGKVAVLDDGKPVEWRDDWVSYWKRMYDELLAERIGGECTPHGEWESISQSQEVRHVFCECGHELGMDRRDSWPFECTKLFAMPNYCPECGRKIRKAVEQ